jgi:hypothetical protein
MSVSVRKTPFKTDPLTGAKADVIWGVYKDKKLVYTSPIEARARAQAAQTRAVLKGQDGLKAFHKSAAKTKKKAARTNPRATKAPRKARRAAAPKKEYLLHKYAGETLVGVSRFKASPLGAKERAIRASQSVVKGRRVTKVVLDDGK